MSETPYFKRILEHSSNYADINKKRSEWDLNPRARKRTTAFRVRLVMTTSVRFRATIILQQGKGICKRLNKCGADLFRNRFFARFRRIIRLYRVVKIVMLEFAARMIYYFVGEMLSESVYD